MQPDKILRSAADGMKSEPKTTPFFFFLRCTSTLPRPVIWELSFSRIYREVMEKKMFW